MPLAANLSEFGLKRVAICATQIPFTRGGAEVLTDGLQRALKSQGILVDVVRIPFKWYPRAAILQNCLVWRMLDLTESNGEPIDAVVCTSFPSYVVAHPRKIVWLVHQHRQAYDLLGSKFSDFTGSAEDTEVRTAIQQLDAQTLGETPLRFAISKTVANRLEKFNGLASQVLYPPPLRAELYRGAPAEDFVLSVGRLDAMKRVDLLIRALPQTAANVRCVVVGTGPELSRLRELALQLQVADRVTFAGWLEDERVAELYSRARAVYFAPFDEDYGYITIEAFLSRKPVITTQDAGGVLEFVAHGENGFVSAPSAGAIAHAVNELFEDGAAARMGERGFERVREITWEHTLGRLFAEQDTPLTLATAST